MGDKDDIDKIIYIHTFLIKVMQLYDFDNMEYFKENNSMRLD